MPSSHVGAESSTAYEIPPRLRLGNMAHGGDCVARLASGQVVFVSGGVPAEEVTIDRLPERRGVARGRVRDLLTPSSDRTIPPCPFFGPCGGCQWQHIRYPAQLDLKQGILADALRHQIKADALPLHDPIPAHPAWNYRSTAQFHLTSTGQLGYVRAGSDDILAITHCDVVHPALNVALTALQEIVPAAIADDPSGAALRQVAVRVAIEGERADLLLVCYGPASARVISERIAAGFATALPHVRGCWFVTSEAGRSHIQHRALLLGRATLRQRIGAVTFRIGPTVFFQVNTQQASALVHLVRQHIAEVRPDQLVDLFCGIGLFALSVADMVSEVSGVDSNEAAIDLARESAIESGIINARFRAASAEAAFAGHESPDAVVVDPPRSGCSRRLLDELAGRKPRAIIYVSCDPTTLARDAARFIRHGYRLTSVQLVDLFPQTYHIESVALFQLAGRQH